MKRIAVIANPENRRTGFFREACASLGFREPVILSWREVLDPEFPLTARIRDTEGLRIESPGEDFEVEKRLWKLGAEDAAREGLWPALTAPEAETARDDPGRVRWQRQWYHGWTRALDRIRASVVERGTPVMNAPEEIAVMFDKDATRTLLAAAGVPVPRGLGICGDFEDLAGRMARARMKRVFVKPCHSSSASGVVALEWDGRTRWRAVTSAAWNPGGRDGPELRNVLRLRRLTGRGEVAPVIDAVCRERALAESWVPKASIGGRTFDLRILVIAGAAAHVVVRTSQTPITNLHLGNRRGDPVAVRAALGETRHAAALETAERAAACFPRCCYVGVDLMISAGGHSVHVAECNAFGDLLPGVTFDGLTPCEAELRSWMRSKGKSML